MNTRRLMTWLIFWSSVAIALGALVWVSFEVVGLEAREAAAQSEASRQETIRRALWRMDSRMAPILAIEASRPHTDYKSIEDARTDWLRKAGSGGGQSPFSGGGTNLSYANSYFVIDQDADTNAASNEPMDQIVGLINAGRAERQYSDGSFTQPQDAGESLDEAEGVGFGISRQLDDKADSDFEARKRVAEIASQSVQQDALNLRDELSKSEPANKEANRSKSYQYDEERDANLENMMPSSTALMDIEGLSSNAPQQRIGSLEPRWIADDRGTMQLVFVRSAVIEGKPVVQGVWLDWNALRSDLLESVNDVLPGSSLVPVYPSGSLMTNIYQLATIPVAFIPPSSQSIATWHWSPTKIGLLITWIAILTTIIAVGAVLRAAIVLSERRGRFVSAVTHELRTPLTTFRLYSQMLADGMVTDEKVRKDYLQILKRESERLTGIVENVLEYARLTRSRSSKDKAAGVQTLSPGALIARFRPALARRAQQSNLDLVVSLDLESHKERTLTVDPHAVERIMMNLVENACKYAAPVDNEDNEDSIEEADTRIHFDITIKNDMLELLIADHGDGIATGEGARIFGEFQRGWRGLSNARSGLGLGLALSRGLAKEMDGDLILTKRRGHGAEFLLTIPLDV